ncbi:hypothetical protein RI129_002988 [Pyrocoelia pectoralis]|uniref:DDE Tnp4 domain-containing protein n=1 Tax=Pyrocoelia pectoralis TaxID=417401 RepID=A0AAN7ZU01_9COLE
MDDFDIIALFGMDDGVNEQNNALGLMLNDIMEPLPELDDLEVRERGERARNQNYYETIVPQYDNFLFKEHFRMSRATFEDLVNVIGHAIPGNPNYLVALRKKVMFSVWMLAKPESFLAAGDRFGLPKSTGHYVFKEIVTIVASLLPNYITWPDKGRCHDEEVVFRRRSHGFPGVVGAIDGCHIQIKAPTGNPIDFYNRNKVHSIILQGVCDHKGRFIDVFIGMPGRMHDARVFRQSDLFEQLSNAENPLLPPNMHLLGDSAYPLMTNLMTPFRDNGHLTREQSIYNIKLSSIRSIIERAFGLLKGKFRRLQYLDVSHLDMGNSMIAAACVIHNFLIDRHEVNFENEAPVDEAMHIPNDDRNDVPNEDLLAVNKRNRIVQLVQ